MPVPSTAAPDLLEHEFQNALRPGVPMHNYTMEKSLAPPSKSKRRARPRSIELSRMKDPLNFDYDLVLGQRVASIMGCGTKVGKDGINVDKVAVCMERSTLLISIDGDTDEIVLKVSEDRRAILAPARRWKSFKPLAKYVGKELGWCWTARNYKGYDDLFILSFHGIEPQIVFCGIASSLWIYMMKRI
jgi:hypothetical protein